MGDGDRARGSMVLLLVEDSPADVELMREGFRRAGVAHELRVARDGAEALEQLNDDATARPDLVLLDLYLPRVSGLEVLEAIKTDPVLREIPVLVLTTSRSDEDAQRAYQLHANAFISKPTSLGELMKLTRSVADFWLRHARLPGSSR